MSTETDSVKAAEKVFLDLFKAGDEQMQPQATKRFLKSFLWAYKDTTNDLWRNNANYRTILHNLDRSVKELKSYNLQKQSYMEHADILGLALGHFMAVIDKGIIENSFTLGDKDNSMSIGIGNIADYIMGSVNILVAELKRINKKVDPSIIRRKIAFIYKKYRGQLPREKQELLAKMAAAFM